MLVAVTPKEINNKTDRRQTCKINKVKLNIFVLQSARNTLRILSAMFNYFKYIYLKIYSMQNQVIIIFIKFGDFKN